MLLVKDLNRGDLEYLYDYTSKPMEDNEDKRMMGMSMFIYSCLGDGGNVDVFSILNMIDSYSVMGNSMMTRITDDRVLESTWNVVRLYNILDDMTHYCEKNVAYPFRELLDVYDLLCHTEYQKYRSNITKINGKYMEWYNKLVNSEDEIMGSVEFIHAYITYCRKILPRIDPKIHLIAAFIVVNYNLCGLGYQMVPIFNDHKILNIVDSVPSSEFQSSYKYKLIIGNYILSGLDVTLTMYEEMI